MSNFIKIWQAGSAVCLFAAVVLLCGCRSDRYYQACAADKAREYLLENAPELTPAQIAFVKYNDPILLTGDGLGTGATGTEKKPCAEGQKEKFEKPSNFTLIATPYLLILTFHASTKSASASF